MIESAQTVCIMQLSGHQSPVKSHEPLQDMGLLMLCSQADRAASKAMDAVPPHLVLSDAVQSQLAYAGICWPAFMLVSLKTATLCMGPCSGCYEMRICCCHEAQKMHTLNLSGPPLLWSHVKAMM